MKLRTFLATLAVGCLATGFTACDDDDDFVHPAAGEYFGTNTMTVGNNIDEDRSSVVKVVSEGENSVSIVLPETAKTSKALMKLPSITLQHLPILGNSKGEFAISQLPTDTIKLKVTREDGSGTKMEIQIYDLASTFVGKKMNLNYTIKMGRMPMPMVDVFEGSKK